MYRNPPNKARLNTKLTSLRKRLTMANPMTIAPPTITICPSWVCACSQLGREGDSPHSGVAPESRLKLGCCGSRCGRFIVNDRLGVNGDRRLVINYRTACPTHLFPSNFSPSSRLLENLRDGSIFVSRTPLDGKIDRNFPVFIENRVIYVTS